jgi:tetratricopeptide (TPR) repeat protein
MFKKNNSIANELRLIGNEHYKSSQFYEALLHYNQSLCHAKPSSLPFALNFANRSAVYFEIEEYEACMENIQLAIDFGYPKDKIPKLMERHERCVELMESCEKNSLNNPWHFFKLSHPANEKIPYIIDCIELRQSKRYGRHLIATQRLEAGDIIAIERPFYKYIMNSSRHTNCANCLKSEKLNLFPCCACNFSEYECGQMKL